MSLSEGRKPISLKQLGVSVVFAAFGGFGLYKIGCAVAFGEVPVRRGRWIGFDDGPIRFVLELGASGIVVAMSVVWFALKLSDRPLDSKLNSLQQLDGQLERPEFTATQIEADRTHDREN